MFWSRHEMPRRPAHPPRHELLTRLAALEAENARVRAEVAALRRELAAGRGEDGPATAPGPAHPAPAEASPARKRPAGKFEANVVVVERHRPRTPRAPVPGRRRGAPDRVVVHAPAVCGGGGAAPSGGR